jgi:hypothetical protein
MKKQIFRLAALLMLTAVVITGCKKYEEGPSISLLSKKSRLAGDWKIEQVLVNGSDQTSAYNLLAGSNYVMSISKDGTYKVTGNWTDDGTWKFSSDKTQLISKSNTAGSTENTTTITKLKSKELWTKETENGTTTEMHYKQ